MTTPIYLDYNATTPVDSRVLDKMIPYFSEIFGNAASIDHMHGYEAKKAVDNARNTISKILGCKSSREIIFTSGATEANNLAIKGIFRRYKQKGNHIITSKIEHPSVLDTLKYLKNEGAIVTYLDVDKYGLINPEDVKKAITDKTILVSIMYANNEIGTIEPISEIGKITKEADVFFHTDAVQIACYYPIHVYDLNVDLLTISGHKIFGPKGIGALFVRSQNPYVQLEPIIHGGGHERGMRSGTLNVPLIVGLAEALRICKNERYKEVDNLSKVRDEFLGKLKEIYPDLKLNGHPSKRLPNNLNITIPGVESKVLINSLKDKISISTGSACSTTKAESSHVLKAIELCEDNIFNTFRVSTNFQSEFESNQILRILNNI